MFRLNLLDILIGTLDIEIWLIGLDAFEPLGILLDEVKDDGGDLVSVRICVGSRLHIR